MDGLKKILIHAMLFSFVWACVPVAKKNSCGEDEIFDNAQRACVPLSILDEDNFPPIGINQNESTTEDIALNFDAAAATDGDGDAINYIVLSGPSHGVLTNCMNKAGSSGLTDRSCTYTPTLNYNGTDSITYKLNDGTTDTEETLTINLTITAVNDAPSVVAVTALSYSIFEDTPTVFTFNYSDPEGDLATSCNAHTPTNLGLGTCSCNAFGVCQVTITPDANENSTNKNFSFIGTVTAGLTSTNTTMGVYVIPVNDAPTIAVPASCTTPLNQDQAILCGTSPTVTDPDTADTPTQTHTWSLATTNTCAFISMNSSTGALTGTPTDNQVGSCNIVYKVTDNSGVAATNSTTSSALPIVVTNLNPVLTATAALTNPSEDLGAQVIGYVTSSTPCTQAFCLTIDTLDMGSLAFTSNTDCDDNGTLSFTSVTSATSSITYTPNANYSSSANCTVEVQFSDGNGGIANASRTMRVLEVNDAPTISPATIGNLTTNEATPAVVEVMTLDEGGGSDENSQNLTITVNSSNTTILPHSAQNIQMFSDSNFSSSYNFLSAGVLGATYDTANGNGESLYLVLTPAIGQSGTVTVTVTVSDNGTTAGAVSVQSVTRTFTLTVTNNAVNHEDWSDIYAVGARVLSDGTIEAQPVVRLNWNAFSAVSDTVAGYWIYRSSSATGPFLTPLNSTMIPTSELTYTDTTLTTSDAGENYYYKVMAVSTENNKVISPSESYAVLRVPIPLDNMSLLHRRIVNLRTCNTMSISVDADNHNRCAYVGPGDNYSGFYDIGEDHFVDRYEASCNFTVDSNICQETGGVGCIGAGTPAVVGVTTGGEDAIYYNRLTGTCYYYDSSWKELSELTSTELEDFAALNQTVQGTIDIASTTFPKKPPMVRIQQFKSHNYCKESPVPAAYPNKTLISRQIHIAAAEWDPDINTDDDEDAIATLETGDSLSLTTSQCNSASGGDLVYQDGLVSALYDTWTATESTAETSHNFVMSGSDATTSCASLYGVQDLVGNVEEWNLDRFHVADTTELNPIGSRMNVGAGEANESYASFSLLPSYNPYSYKSNTINAESVADINNNAALDDFDLDAGFAADLDDVFAPFGMPTEDIDSSILATTFDFNDDQVIFEDTVVAGGNLTVDISELLGLISGGNSMDEEAAGRYTMRFRQVCHGDVDDDGGCDDAGSTVQSTGTEINNQTGFRCMLRVPN